MKPIALLLVVLFAVTRHASGQTLPEGSKLLTQHGDWRVMCAPSPSGVKQEICAVVQTVIAAEDDKTMLSVSIEKFADGKLLLRVVAPEGVLLPPGLGLKIDSEDIGRAPYVRCHASGCYAQIVVEQTLAEKFKRGKTAVFSIFRTEQAGLGFPISLAGFNEALKKLETIPIALQR